MLRLALRTYVRHVAPLTLVALVAFAPLLVVALRVPAADEPEVARGQYLLAWLLAGIAWIVQFALAGAAAPAARALAAGAPLAQRRALVDGVAGLARAIVPCACVLAAVLVGGLVLILPGIALVVLLALTGASEARGMPAPLVDSVAAVRARLVPVAIAVVAIVALDLALAALAHALLHEPLAKKPTPDQLAASRWVVRAVAAGLAVVSPLPACVLAALRIR